MKALLIFLVMAPHFSTQQYGNHYENELHTGHQQSYISDYDEGYYRRSSRRHKKKHGSDRRPRDYDYPEACNCDCRMCDPKPCCRLVCTCEPEAETNQDTETGQAPENYGGPTNVVFVPYPFPLVVPGQPLSLPTASTTRATTEPTTKSTTAKTTTTKNTTTKTTSKTTTKTTTKRTKKPVARVNSDEDSTLSTGLQDLLDLFKKDTKVRIGISKRNPVVRRLKTTTRLPKYGIVPLSDHLLESLISQVRSVKDLQSYT